MNNPNPKTPFTVDEIERLAELLSHVIDGPEQGVCTREDVEKMEWLLMRAFHRHGFDVWGQKADYLRRKHG